MRTNKLFNIVDYMVDKFIFLINELHITYKIRKFPNGFSTITVNHTHNKIAELEKIWDDIKSYYEPKYSPPIENIHAIKDQQQA
jgi:hypothetical protein